MKDKKLTDSEIVKALECCTKGLDCKNCPANPHKGNYGYCTGLLLKDTLDLINRLQEEKDDLFYKLTGVMHSVDKWLDGDELKQDEVNRAATMREKTLQIVESLQAENDRLNKELETEKNQVIRLENQIERLLSMNQAKLDTIHDLQEENNWYNETLNTTKVEAYKEFAERVKQNKRKLFNYIYSSTGFDNQIDNLLKEMVGEDK